MVRDVDDLERILIWTGFGKGFRGFGQDFNLERIW